jgi:hypothetical protein
MFKYTLIIAPGQRPMGLMESLSKFEPSLTLLMKFDGVVAIGAVFTSLCDIPNIGWFLHDTDERYTTFARFSV